LKKSKLYGGITMYQKVKLYKILALAATALVVFSGCSMLKDKGDGTADANAYEKIQQNLMNMTSYQSEATVKYISNKNTNEYQTLQQCRISGEYRIEVTGPEDVAGNITLSDGETICQFNPNVSGKIAVGSKESPERSEIFLTTFVKNYLNSKEVSLEVSNFGEGRATVLEASVPGTHPYLASEKLWVDNETYKPLQLVIYDPDGAERVVITYNSFEYNVALDDSLFTVPVAAE